MRQPRQSGDLRPPDQPAATTAQPATTQNISPTERALMASPPEGSFMTHGGRARRPHSWIPRAHAGMSESGAAARVVGAAIALIPGAVAAIHTAHVARTAREDVVGGTVHPVNF